MKKITATLFVSACLASASAWSVPPQGTLSDDGKWCSTGTRWAPANATHLCDKAKRGAMDIKPTNDQGKDPKRQRAAAVDDKRL